MVEVITITKEELKYINECFNNNPKFIQISFNKGNLGLNMIEEFKQND